MSISYSDVTPAAVSTVRLVDLPDLGPVDTTQTEHGNYQQKEVAGDLALVLTLETRTNLSDRLVVARTSLGVWPKQALNSRDLKKPQRL